MPDHDIINIAIIGGATYCRELLEKTTLEYGEQAFNARIVAVADPDFDTPGMQVARQLGLITVGDYHELYAAEHDIHLFIILTPDQDILEDILRTKPAHIRIQSYRVFEVFWNAISIEERKLRERNREVETILNGIKDFIIVIDANMEILEVNDAFLQKMGYSPEEVIGKKCHAIFQKVDQQCQHLDFTCPLEDIVRNKQPVRQILTRRKQSGDTRYIEVSIFPIWEKNGKISKFIEISRDITEQKMEEEEIMSRLEQMVAERTRQLKETHDQLLHKDKMTSLGKLSASVVHEINNPIAGSLNLVMLMKRIIDEGPVGDGELTEFDEYLTLMETETRRVSRIVSDLLAFSRQSKVEPKRLNLNELIERTLILNANLLKLHAVKVKKRLHPKLPEIVGSDDQLLQVFMNLISNAAEAMEGMGDGVLNIETKYSSKHGRISVSFKDTGPGIPNENRAKVFEPFFTTKKKGKGVGLGLSVAYGIIQDHGGAIKVKSKPGKGATFKIEFPLERAQDQQASQGGMHG